MLQGKLMVCLLLAVLCWHFETKESMLNLASMKNIKLSQELKGRLQSQQKMFTKATAKNDAAQKLAL